MSLAVTLKQRLHIWIGTGIFYLFLLTHRSKETEPCMQKTSPIFS